MILFVTFEHNQERHRNLPLRNTRTNHCLDFSMTSQHDYILQLFSCSFVRIAQKMHTVSMDSYGVSCSHEVAVDWDCRTLAQIVILPLSFRKPSKCIMVMLADGPNVRCSNCEDSLRYQCHLCNQTIDYSACVST